MNARLTIFLGLFVATLSVYRANATPVYDWSITGGDTGAGTLTIGAVDGNGFDIVGITGTVDSQTITGLQGGNPGPQGQNNGPFIFDNLLYPTALGSYLDNNGVLLSLQNGTQANIYGNGNFDYAFATYDFTSGTYPINTGSGDDFEITPSPSTPVSEPASIAVALAGLVLIGCAQYVRHRDRSATP